MVETNPCFLLSRVVVYLSVSVLQSIPFLERMTQMETVLNAMLVKMELMEHHQVLQSARARLSLAFGEWYVMLTPSGTGVVVISHRWCSHDPELRLLCFAIGWCFAGLRRMQELMPVTLLKTHRT